MKKFKVLISENVTHMHRLVIECQDIETADKLADELDKCRMEHPDDISVMAERIGMKVVRLDMDYCIDSDRPEIEDVDFYEEET